MELYERVVVAVVVVKCSEEDEDVDGLSGGLDAMTYEALGEGK